MHLSSPISSVAKPLTTQLDLDQKDCTGQTCQILSGFGIGTLVNIISRPVKPCASGSPGQAQFGTPLNSSKGAQVQQLCTAQPHETSLTQLDWVSEFRDHCAMYSKPNHLSIYQEGHYFPLTGLGTILGMVVFLPRLLHAMKDIRAHVQPGDELCCSWGCTSGSAYLQVQSLQRQWSRGNLG